MPTLEADGKSVEVTDNGYLVDSNEWTKAIGQKIADLDELEMTEEHWDVIDYLRAEHAENPGSEANERGIMKEMAKKWGKKLTSKYMYQLFPGMPSKQGRKIGGLSQSTRKGGY